MNHLTWNDPTTATTRYKTYSFYRKSTAGIILKFQVCLCTADVNKTLDVLTLFTPDREDDDSHPDRYPPLPLHREGKNRIK